MDRVKVAEELLKLAKELTAANPIEQLKEVVEKASSFMNVGAELKKAGLKYDFSTSMMPIYMVKIGGQNYAILSKKYADDADAYVGNIAIGKM